MEQAKSSKSLVMELVEEIEATDFNIYKPSKKEPSEKIICVIEDEYIKKIQALERIYAKEHAMLDVQRQYDPEDVEISNEMVRVGKKQQALYYLLWYTVALRYNLYSRLGVEDEGIGIREGWVLVSIPRKKNPLLEMLRGGFELP